MNNPVELTHDLQELLAHPDALFRNLIESVRCGVYMANTDENLFFVNRAFIHMLGYDHREEMLGLNISRDIWFDAREREPYLEILRKKGFVHEYEVRVKRRDGTPAILCSTSNYIRNDDGQVIGSEGIVHDITDRKALENKLMFEKRKLEEILTFDERVSAIRKLDALVDFVVSKATEILRARRCSLMLLDDSTQELCIKGAKGIHDRVVRTCRVPVGDPIAGLVAREGSEVLVQDIETDPRFVRRNRKSYGHRSFMSVAVKVLGRSIGVVNVSDKIDGDKEPFTDLDLKILSAIVRQAAISIENAKLIKELEYLSVTDPVTNLSNYRVFVTCLQEEIQRFQRFAEQFSLLMVDVDNFKLYNDTFGHVEGDLFLKMLGKLFVNNLRSIDKVCRYSGDEFVILLPGTKLKKAEMVAGKLRSLVEKYPFQKQMTVSIGVAEYRKPLSRFDFTLRVDRALYQAKRQGRNMVQVSG